MPDHPSKPSPEQDDRFPSGPWSGFWIQGSTKGRQQMGLAFADRTVSGDGRDAIGPFTCKGSYCTDAGTMTMIKAYPSHRIEYAGFAEGDGIWGTWSLRIGSQTFDRGGFHIWPDATGTGDGDTLAAEEPIPAIAF